MFAPSRRLLFALDAMLDIAYHGAGDPVTSLDLTERLGVSRRYLEPVLQELGRAGLLDSVRGPGGGYRLARPRDQIMLGEILRVVRMLDQGADPLVDEQGSALGMAVIWPMVTSLLEKLGQELDIISLDVLCQQARHAGIPSAAVERMDYVI